MSAGRLALRLGALTASLILSWVPAQASDWGCQVLLCLSNPGSPTEYAECRPPIEKLYSVLASGGSFPSCSEGGMSTSKMGLQLFQCPPGWALKDNHALFGSNVCQSLTETRRVCTDETTGHNGKPQQVCRDVPLERKADRNPKPHYIDVTYPDGKGGTTTQRVWFSLKD